MSLIHCQTDAATFLCLYETFYYFYKEGLLCQKQNFRNSFLPLSHPAVWFLSWAFIMSPSTPANFRLLPPNTHCILSHWNGSSGFSVHSSLPAKRPNTSHSAWQNQLTDQSSSSSASRPSQSVQWCRFIFRHLFASTNQGNESKVEYEMEQQGFAE